MTFRLIFSLTFLASAFFGQTNFNYKKLNDSTFKKGDKIIGPDILFALSGPSTRYSYFTDSVDKIALFLNRHPTFKVEIGSHTDSRGNKEANLKLSQARAQYIVDYLTKTKHIDSSRVTPKGYGSTALFIDDLRIHQCKTKDEKEGLHQKNRRTEIKILSTN